jgi:hypothetical protein
MAAQVERRAEALPAMGRHQHQASPRVEPCEGRGAEPVVVAHRLQQRVDDRVAGQEDVAGRDPLGEQGVPGGRGRGEVERRDPGREDPVHLLRKRLPAVAGPEPGLHVRGGDPLEEGGERRGKRGGGVALDQDHVGPHPPEQWRQPIQDARRDAGRRLARHHQVEIHVRLEVEYLEHLIEHRAMLGRDADLALELGRRRAQGADDGRHLDRLRPGAEDAEDADHRAACAACSRSASVCIVTNRNPCSTTRANTCRSTASRTPS